MKFIKLTALTQTRNPKYEKPIWIEHVNPCWFNVADISAITATAGGTLIRQCGFEKWEKVAEPLERVMQLLVTDFSPDAHVVQSS